MFIIFIIIKLISPPKINPNKMPDKPTIEAEHIKIVLILL